MQKRAMENARAYAILLVGFTIGALVAPVVIGLVVAAVAFVVQG